MKMKKMRKTLVTALVCGCFLNVQAQSVPLPTVDLYDSGMMNMAIQSHAQTYGIRKQNYEMYVDMAFEAAKKDEWRNVLIYTESALDTGFWNAELYFMRGIAYERLGYLKEAQKEYKTAKRKGSIYAADALDLLKAKMK